jgi:pyrrolidone-carboxylate peptidase
VQSFEYASRGFDDLEFPEAADTRRVLISGFDPFLLDRDIGQSNPSGLAALALDGTQLPLAKGRMWIEAVTFPVRFEDFDDGIVETFFVDALAAHSIDLIVTISMGRDAFDLERFPGRRRSATAPDNRNVVTGADARTPLLPKLAGAPLEGPEFVEFSLPAADMLAIQSPWPVRDNRRVTSLERGELEPASLAELSFDTAVQGSGGGYLSNEISYRSVLLLGRMGSRVPVGHLHTPSVVGHDPVIEGRILAQIRALLIAAASAPGPMAQ